MSRRLLSCRYELAQNNLNVQSYDHLINNGLTSALPTVLSRSWLSLVTFHVRAHCKIILLMNRVYVAAIWLKSWLKKRRYYYLLKNVRRNTWTNSIFFTVCLLRKHDDINTTLLQKYLRITYFITFINTILFQFFIIHESNIFYLWYR